MERHLDAARDLERIEEWDKASDQLSIHVRSRKSDRIIALSHEANEHLRANRSRQALIRFRAIGNTDGIFQSFKQLGNDELAVEYYLHTIDTDYSLQYLHDRAEELTISKKLLKSATNASIHAVRRYWIQNHDMVFTVELCRICLHRNRMHMIEIVDKYLSTLPHGIHDYKSYPHELLLLTLEARSYNVLVEMVGIIVNHREKFSEDFYNFVEKVRETGETEKDNVLLACYWHAYDRELFEENLKSIEIDERNFELFARSSSFYRKAAEHLISKPKPSKKEMQRAARICRDQRDYEYAGRIYERADNIKSAGKMYREAGLYRDALRCYQGTGDEPGAARTFEEMEDFESARKIWEKLGRIRDLSRIEKTLKRKQRDESEASQRELF